MRMNHYTAWQIPATLVMSVAFSMLLVLPPPADMNAAAVGDGDVTPVRVVNAVVAHLYVTCMTVSGLLSTKCINDFAQDYIAVNKTPAVHLPAFVEFRNNWEKEHP